MAEEKLYLQQELELPDTKLSGLQQDNKELKNILQSEKSKVYNLEKTLSENQKEIKHYNDMQKNLENEKAHLVQEIRDKNIEIQKMKVLMYEKFLLYYLC